MLKKILNYIKKIFNIEGKRNEIKRQEYYDFGFQYGDLIIAARYKNKEEYERIESGHRRGPYIVLKELDDCFLCLEGTSKVYTSPKLIPFIFKIIDKNLLLKDTSFKVYNLHKVSKERYEEYIGHIGLENIEKINKKREMFNVRKNGEIHFYKNTYKKGDILKDLNTKKLYLILEDKDNEYEVLEANDNKNEKNYIYKKLYISKNNEYGLYDFLDKEELDKVIEDYEDFNTIKRGSIISYDNSLYYVYGENSEYLVYLIYDDKISDNIITVNEKNYYTHFKTFKLNKDNPLFELYDNASESELEYNKDVKKNHSHKIKTHNKIKKNINKKRKSKYQRGIIVETKTMSHDKYIVSERKNTNSFFAYSIEELEKGILKEEFFIGDCVRIIKEDNSKYMKKIEELENVESKEKVLQKSNKN